MDTKIYNIIFAVGSFLILISSVLVMENVVWGKYSFATGAVFYAFCRIKMLYKGNDFRMKRLDRFYFLSVLFLAIASYFQFKGSGPWVVLLLLVAIIEFYASVRTSYYEKLIATQKEKLSTSDNPDLDSFTKG